MRWITPIFVLFALLIALPHPASAQLPLSEPQETAPEASDPFDRTTPRSTVAALISALAERNYVFAGNYFALDEDDPVRAARLARALQASLDTGGNLVPFAELSNEPTGRIEDQLPPDMERVGTLGGPAEVPILLARADPAPADGEAAAGALPTPIWRISEETIAALDERADGLLLEGQAEAFIIAGAPLADWALLVGLLLIAFGIFWLLSWLILAGLRRILANPEDNGFYRFLFAALPPLSLLLAVIVFRVWGDDAPIAIVARQAMFRYVGVLAWVAIVWFAIRLVDAITGKLTSKLDARERRQAASAVTLARRAIKLLLIAVAAIAILDTLGVDITTGVAALGIGGIALALGAQKTVENLVGSVTVVADRPIEVGDFCKVGDVLGTVEDIGMRSTRIRTNDRTLVTIPNGDFSSRQIENYSQRDRFLFNPVIGLEYGISTSQLQEGVGIVEQVLADHPLVSEDPRRVKLANFGPSSLDIEVFTYILVEDFSESLSIRHELLLAIFERLEEAGLSIAFPTQTVYLRSD